MREYPNKIDLLSVLASAASPGRGPGGHTAEHGGLARRRHGSAVVGAHLGVARQHLVYAPRPAVCKGCARSVISLSNPLTVHFTEHKYEYFSFLTPNIARLSN